jgi:exopolyphosphatase / guanosine-5'-triphosphate,3'-diphosphate pyrophosphatase
VANLPFRGAVLDLGSNTFKLLLAEQSGTTLRLHHEKAYPVRLGEGVALTRRIQSTSCRRALRQMTLLQRKMRAFHPDQVVAVGTGTLRRATNAKSFLLPASRILGKKISLLSGHEEGRLISLASRELTRKKKPRFHIDLGGGSLEVIDSLHPAHPKIVSLNLGCVAVRDSLLPHHPPSQKEWDHAVHSIRRALRKIPHPSAPTQATFSGGTGHTYACLLSGRNRKARRLDGFLLSLPQLERLLRKVRPLTLRQLHLLPGMPRDRASLAHSAFLVIRETMHRLHLPSVQLTTHGLRYGVWLDRLAPQPVKRIIR